MKALSLPSAICSLVSGCAVLVAAWLVLTLSAGSSTYAAAPSDPSDGKAPDLVGCWSTYAVPTVAPTEMYDVAALGPNDVWTAGSQQTDLGGTRPRIHHWNGSTWSIVLSPTGPGYDTILSSIEALAANEIWVAGSSSGASYFMRWNGVDWYVVSTPNIGPIIGLSALSPIDMWALSPNSAMHWNGTTWTVHPLPTGFLEHPRAISVAAPDQVWVGGSTEPSAPKMLRWNGTEWAVVDLPSLPAVDYEVLAIDALSPTEAWAVGYVWMPQSSGYLPLTLRWTGSQWTNVPAPPAPGYGFRLQAVDALSSTDVWAAGYDSDAARIMHWDGQAWTFVQLPGRTEYGDLRSIAAISASNVWSVGEARGGTFEAPLVLHYSDPCSPPSPTPTATPTSTATPWPVPNCWAEVYVPVTGALVDVDAVSPTEAWAVAEYHNGLLHWDSNAWSPVSGLPQFTQLTAVEALASNDVWVVGSGPGFWDDDTFTAHWNGSQWSRVPSPNGSGSYNVLYSISALASNDIWAVGTSSNTDGDSGSVLTMHWDGSQWTNMGGVWAGLMDLLYSVDAVSPTEVWAGGYTYSQGPYLPLLMRWNGSTWQRVTMPAVPSGINPVRNVEATSASDVWVAVSGIPLLHWDGAAWTTHPGVGASDMEALSSNDIWAVGGSVRHWNGSIWEVVVDTPPAIWLNAVSPLNADDVWAVGVLDEWSTDLPVALHYMASCPPPPPSPTPTSTPLPPRCPNERFTDVCPSDYFYQPVLALSDLDILAGYSTAPPCDGPDHIPCFKPYNGSTRGQIAKVVSLAAGFTEPAPAQQTFEDVLVGSTFWEYIERMASRDIIQGYPCGGPGEPCVLPDNRPYFRPNNPVTRGQLAKMTSEAFGFSEPVSGQTFEDVVPGSTFYEWVQRIASRGIIQGYPCGGAGEPCGPEERPYFRPNNPVTRGQTAKIVHLGMLQIPPTPTQPPTFTAEPTGTPTVTPTNTVAPAASHTTIPTSTPAP